MSKQSAEQIFHQALDISVDQRDVYLQGACGADIALRNKVDALLEADADAGSFMENTLTGVLQSSPHSNQLTNSPSESAGQELGRYKLLQQIGEGGFGTVWMAEQREPVKRRVALKIIKLGMDTKQVIARFEAERQALAMMDHPNIAKVLDAGSTETGRPYFVMEYIKGIPIIEFCDNEKLDTTKRLDLFIKVCNSIQHAHQKGIIHRDIKPSNILITLHDGKPVPKVIDFGIAKATNTELTTKTLFTEHKQMIGTPAYMSPEQAEMSGLDIDTRSDIYSLGVLLYELLTGTTPFDMRDLIKAGYAEMMRIIREEEPHKPSTRLSTLGDTATQTAFKRRVDVKKLGLLLQGDLDWIAMKCLEKDRTRRYESANNLADDIERHLNDEPVQAGPPSKTYKLRKFFKRNQRETIAGASFISILLIAFIVMSILYQWANTQKNRLIEQSQTASNAMHEAAEILVDTYDEISKKSNIKEELLLPVGDPSEYKGIEVDGLGIAAKNLAIYLSESIKDEKQARIEIEQRAKDLQKVAEFQSNQIGSIQPEIMGNLIREAIINEAPVEIRDNIRESLTQINFTNISLNTLEQNIFDPTFETITNDFKDQPVVQARLYFALGDSAHKLGMLNKALEPKKLAVESMKEHLGVENEDTLYAKSELADLYLDLTQLEESETLFREVLTGFQKLFGEKHKSTINANLKMGIILAERYKYQQAMNFFQNALQNSRETLGPESEFTLGAMNNMGFMMMNLSRYKEGEKYFREAMEINEKIKGQEHLHTIHCMANLAYSLNRQNKYDESEIFFEKTLTLRKKIQGDNHPETLNTKRNMAMLLKNMGKKNEAVSLMSSAVEGCIHTYGPDHFITKQFRGQYADLLTDINKWEEAEDQLRKNIDSSIKIHGMKHDITAAALWELSRLKINQSKWDEAEITIRQSTDIYLELYGTTHINYIISKGNIAVSLNNQDKGEEALEIIKDILQHSGDTLAPEFWHTYRLHGIKGNALTVVNRFSESETVLLNAYDKLSELLGNKNKQTKDVCRYIVQLYESWHEAEPDKGYDTELDTWKSRL